MKFFVSSTASGKHFLFQRSTINSKGKLFSYHFFIATVHSNFRNKAVVSDTNTSLFASVHIIFYFDLAASAVFGSFASFSCTASRDIVNGQSQIFNVQFTNQLTVILRRIALNFYRPARQRIFRKTSALFNFFVCFISKIGISGISVIEQTYQTTSKISLNC